MQPLKITGMDPSLRNWGLAGALLDPVTLQLQVKGVQVTQPVLTTGKQARKSCEDIEAAKQLYEGALAACQEADAIFVEVPHNGGQNPRSVVSYAVVCGVIGALRAQGFPIYELTAKDIKLAGAGHENASKNEQIQWATTKHPEAPWPMHQGKVNASKAEHMADALAAIYAGIQSNEFRQLLPILRRAA